MQVFGLIEDKYLHIYFAICMLCFIHKFTLYMFMVTAKMKKQIEYYIEVVNMHIGLVHKIKFRI